MERELALAFARRLRDLRDAAGLAQERAAERAGMSRNHYQLLESGLSDRARCRRCSRSLGRSSATRPSSSRASPADRRRFEALIHRGVLPIDVGARLRLRCGSTEGAVRGREDAGRQGASSDDGVDGAFAVSRPSDWSPVGLDIDPTPGDPVLVLAGGRDYLDVATA
ncbi:helix-turn-helix domain-containing protein, partial [Luteimicrobium subarcticum]|uniref:helix-turn-helix domain-containing protein n=1 Tax=Luteimicrobium subarcticum TaxID=620910 RepID=UPI003CCB8E35